MSTYKELVYLILDKLKLNSDDAQFTEEHVIFLLGKYRTFLLKQRYSDVKKQIPESNYQTICLNLKEVPAISGEPCEGGSYLRSIVKVPILMKIGNPMVYPIDYYQGDISYVSRERMRYVGYNKYLNNIIYASIAPDGYLYFKSFNPQYLNLQSVKMTGIFEDIEEVFSLECSSSESTISCDIIDRDFPIEEALVPPLIDLTTKVLEGAIYEPEDSGNNAEDDLSNVTIKK